jgi:class 3 adenylate cyclase
MRRRTPLQPGWRGELLPTSSTQYASSDGVSIAYQVHGEGPLDLVYLPGFVSHVEHMWEFPPCARFLRRLASFSRLILMDRRGQGLSDRLGRPPTLEESMDDLIAVLDAVGSERAALFGASEGGPVSIVTAATHPTRVSALALYGTYARLLASDGYPQGLSEEGFRRWQRLVRTEWGGPVTSRLWAPSMEGDAAFEQWWGKLLRLGTSPSGAMELLELYVEGDVRRVLDSVSAPTLVLHRRDDRMTPARMGRYIADRIPEARYVELEGTDHIPFTGDADALLDEVEEFLIGTRRAREPDRALVTLLFTDVVDSTATAARLGDRRWRELVERHDATVRHELNVHRGREIKTLGDGFLATFDGPARAIRCARALRDRLAELGIQLRAGVHTGEVEVIGNDVGGIAVNIGARIGTTAAAGEVLVSSTVKELVVGSGLEFKDRGAHDLKGVPGSWRLFALLD